MDRTLTLVIPVYNEEMNLPDFAPSVLQKASEKDWKVIFVDDCSMDGSGGILKSLREKYDFTYIRNKRNRGYGGAIKQGIERVGTDLLITVDADGQHNLEDIPVMMQALLELDADMVVGKRDRSTSSFYRRIGKSIIKIIAKILIGKTVSDINSGFKLYDSKLAKKYIKLCPNTMAFSESIMFAFYVQKHLVIEVPVRVMNRTGGKSTISLKTAFQTTIEIFNLVMLFNPLNMFLPIALICILFGIGWGLPILIAGRGVSVGAMLAIVSGLLAVFLGLIAEQLSKMRINSL